MVDLFIRSAFIVRNKQKRIIIITQYCLQRRWQLRGDDNDESNTALHWESRVETAGHLQILLRNKRRVLPIRRADVFHEVWIVDVRWIHGEKQRLRPGGVMCVSEICFLLSIAVKK